MSGSFTVINNTKYSTKILQELADLTFEPTTHKQCTVTFMYREFDIEDGGPYCRGGKTDGYKSERNNNRRVWQTDPDFRLYVPSPRYWDKLKTSMDLLATSLTDEQDLAPMQFTFDVVRVLRRLHELFLPYGNSHGSKDGNTYTRKPVPADLHRIPMTERLPKQDRPKKTREEAQQALLDNYGPGPIMGGCSSTRPYQWSLMDIESYYAREYKRRVEWKDKLEKKGGIVQPWERLETFPQYLRRMADEFESGVARRGRMCEVDWSKAQKWESGQ